MPLFQLPEISGIIDRRILINYRVSPEVVQEILPSPFKPLTINGFSIVGICLIRLKNMTPNWMNSNYFGLSSENAAHRIAVQWQTSKGLKEGVFIPRRDTNSQLVSFFGGRIFPGHQHKSNFEVIEKNQEFQIRFEHKGKKMLDVHCRRSEVFNRDSIFEDLPPVSNFFKRGSLGYSPEFGNTRYSGMELKTKTWSMLPLETLKVESQYFSDTKKFPKGSITFDNAVLMKSIQHSWISHPTINK